MDQQDYDAKVMILKQTIKDTSLLKKRLRQLTRRFEKSKNVARVAKTTNPGSSASKAPKREKPTKSPIREPFPAYTERVVNQLIQWSLIHEDGSIHDLDVSDDNDAEELSEWEDSTVRIPTRGSETYWFIMLSEAWARGIEPEDFLENFKTRWSIAPVYFTIISGGTPNAAIGFRSDELDFRSRAPRSAA